MALEDLRREAIIEIARKDETLQVQHQFRATSEQDAARWQVHLQEVKQEADAYIKDLQDLHFLKEQAVETEFNQQLMQARYALQHAENKIMLFEQEATDGMVQHLSHLHATQSRCEWLEQQDQAKSAEIERCKMI